MTPAPNMVLLENLERAVLARLHELVPEFRAHVEECVACGEFHDWLHWRHEDGTNEWHAKCPEMGVELSMPLKFGNRDEDTRG